LNFYRLEGVWRGRPGAEGRIARPLLGRRDEFRPGLVDGHDTTQIW
jgi:hypothetical protein